MVDRASRDKVTEIFEAFLDDRIAAFEFDIQLHEIESSDPTVNEVVQEAWFHYDDCVDHYVAWSKTEWDYFQRLLLVLRSDAEVSSPVVSRWAWDHGLAWFALAVFVGAAFAVGWGWHLLLVSVPFGILSLLISAYRRRMEPEFRKSELARVPFLSFAQMRQLWRRFPEFKKRKYRPEIQNRRIRSEAANHFHHVCHYALWLALAPVALLFQGFPSADRGLLEITQV